jgi:endonuclease/exonuclease/phosphatase family metal-dependent hydrolase
VDATEHSSAPAAPPAPDATFVVGTFNVHAGVDGWGRPFDVVGACRAIDADVLVLEETWTPEGNPGVACAVGDALGYQVFEHALAGGRLARPHPHADHRWMRPLDWRGASHAIYLDSERPFSHQVRASSRFSEAQPGHWGLAVLSRLPITHTEVVELGRLSRDRARRAALVVGVRVGEEVVTVVGTHMSHITYGALLHFLRIRRHLRGLAGSEPAVLVGDMNLWGPPVAAFFPRWRRALRGKTWPAWRPHSQVDHVLVHGRLDVVDADVLAMSGSDHRPARVRLRVQGCAAR